MSRLRTPAPTLVGEENGLPAPTGAKKRATGDYWRLKRISLTEEAFRAAFSPAQADLLLAALALKPEEHLAAREASAAVGWTYDTFRKECSFDAANVAPQGRRKRYARSTLVRIAENLRAGRSPP